MAEYTIARANAAAGPFTPRAHIHRHERRHEGAGGSLATRRFPFRMNLIIKAGSIGLTMFVRTHNRNQWRIS
jgi:hypothetical protein